MSEEKSGTNPLDTLCQDEYSPRDRYEDAPTILTKCSEFIHGKALFGSYPSQEDVEALEELGVRVFINLTDPEKEQLPEYKTEHTYIKYVITDHGVPEDNRNYAKFIVHICDVLRDLAMEERIYLHCKGGHGRSGLVVASIIAYYYQKHPNEAISHTCYYHSQRPNIREKWKLLGSPHNKIQKTFVGRFFRQLKYGKDSQSKFTLCLDNSSPHEVVIPDVGTFKNAYFAFQYFKAPNNEKYVQELLKGSYRKELLVYTSKKVWQQNKRYYMYVVLKHKFTQHPELRENLLNTGLRYFRKISTNNYWGGKGNVHGKLLGLLREEFLREL